jgi:hypothetical protein
MTKTMWAEITALKKIIENGFFYQNRTENNENNSHFVDSISHYPTGCVTLLHIYTSIVVV